jgi:dCMP deaminase
MIFFDESSQRDRCFVNHAECMSLLSKDLSTKTGCVIVAPDMSVLCTGYNRFPTGCLERAERFLRPAKYMWTEHSERVAFGFAARHGIALNGSTLYSNWWPCIECSRGIIESGIRRVVGFKPDLSHPKYGEEFREGLLMLDEAGVLTSFIGTREQVQK